MNYILYKLYFTTGVHFGNGSLEDSNDTFEADTLFSALCQEAIKDNALDKLLSLVNDEKIVFSDAFPFVNNTYYLPKPALHIESKEDAGDSVVKKAYKNMRYVPSDCLDTFLTGTMDIERTRDLKDYGKHVVKTSVSIRGEEEPKPYRVGEFYYNKGNGLYVIVAYDNKESLGFLDDLISSLSFAGIGGKRYAGLGRFDYHTEEVPDNILKRLNGDGDYCMTLSVSLPKNDELEAAIDGSSYIIERKAGFVSSSTYSDTLLRKKDMYLFKSGSCFNKTYKGDIYDVSSEGKHPVYRYAKPLFMGVSV